MSTICKLDRSVRLDRYLRKRARREMQADLSTVRMIIKQQRGHGVASPEMVLREVVMNLTLDAVTKIHLDPARTGARKEAILARLAA